MKLVLLAQLLAPFLAPADSVRIPPNGVYVVGALHALHATEPDFDFAALRRVITAIEPRVMVLEVRPDELAERKETPGRPEYPQVVWPLLEGSETRAIAMEPGDSLFRALVAEATRAMKEFTRRDSAGAAAWASYQRALTVLLQSHWRSPADAHDHVTDDVARALYVSQAALVGDDYRRVQDRWDGYMIERAREAVRANPLARVLVLASYRNRHRLEEALRSAFPDRVIPMDVFVR